MTGPARLDQGGEDVRASREVQLQNAAFVELLGVDLQPHHRGGLVRVTGQVVNVVGLDGSGNPQGVGVDYDTATIDVRIVGMVGAEETALHRGSLGGDSGSLDYVLPFPSPYKRISIRARFIFNGDPTERLGTTTAIPRVGATAQVRLAR
jgi:hypothetical protein